ncbi:hypothetical protein ASG52_02690 [Methylobacterium sp. Leaf456]|uniref:hypothetical protein n=1 Tax=Methylobacterium sp. Leaf456 TaxID=1736382 RepID=UPI0006FBDCAD|nr:hypothetical protein [Methylobacterium sp. Leaf456]KQT57003.1 hypothetical protein ASG52_02690 [Methylobacterium sp. Leaf456]
MSEPARQTASHESAIRGPGTAAPLRDWLAAMRAVTETRPTETRAEPAAEPVLRPRIVEAAPIEPEPVAKVEIAAEDVRPTLQDSRGGWAPRLVNVAKSGEEADDELAEIMAENMMLKAKLRLEAERRDELQILLAAELRELRAHIAEEVGKMEDLRAERDLWRARCEALASPLFQIGQR